MITISEYNRSEIPFESAANIITTCGDGDLLEGMKAIQKIYLNGDSDTEDKYCIEFNAYNAVFGPMRKLFHGA